MQRRGFLGAILAAGFAPAAIGSGVLMPVRRIIGPPLLFKAVDFWPLNIDAITREALWILDRNLILSASVNGEYRHPWTGESHTLKIRKPQRYVVRSGA